MNHPRAATISDQIEPTPIPRRRWVVACVLGLGVLINYFDRVNISVSQDALHAAFGISAVQFGYLLSAYSWTYAALQLPCGVLLDRFGVKLVGRVSTFLWSVASFGAAAATGVGSFFAARLLLGVGEAPTFPAKFQSRRLLVSITRTQPRHRHLRCRLEIRARRRRPAAWPAANPLRLALELRRHRHSQLRLFRPLLLDLPQSERR